MQPPSETKLNPHQLAAVEHSKGPLLIIAGAGTGKTTVITEKIRHLVASGAATPSQILALTFTEKAAKEMEERVDKALPFGYTQMWISTFHSFCDRILRRDALHIGLDPRYKLTTQADIIQFVRKNLFAFELEYFRPLGNPTKFVSAMIDHFSRLQDEDITPGEYITFAKGKLKQSKKLEQEMVVEARKWLELANAYKVFEELKVKEALMDFGNLITQTLKLFRERPNVLQSYQTQFKYIMVDEFQDTNIAQYELLKLLAPPTKNSNLTTVGDDSQSIFKFRGAAISNILHFMDDYKKAKTIILTQNYRSTQEILDTSYRLIQHNNPDTLEVKLGITKNLTSGSGKGKKVTLIHEDRVENEAEEVAKEIASLASSGKDFRFSDFAILVRANNHADPFIRALQRAGIPYQYLGPGKLFKQPEIVELISLLKVLADFEDSVSLYRLLSMDEFSISVRDLVSITNAAKRKNRSLFEACEKLDEVRVSEDTEKKLGFLLPLLSALIEKTKKETAGQLLYDFLSQTNLLAKLLNPDTPDAQKKALNISKFFDKLKSYESSHEDASVSAIVDWIQLSAELGESPLSAETDWGDTNAVNILTVHSSKGLEFPVVFLVNLVSQRFPSTERRETLPIPDELIREVLPEGDYHLQEERRLFYVGITRAKKLLYFTAADHYSEKRGKKLSQFIFEALGDDSVSSEQRPEKTEQLSFTDYHFSLHVKPETPPEAEFHIDYISYSQIDAFRTCPLHYKMRNIVRLSPPASAALSFGNSIHSSLNDFYTKVSLGQEANESLLVHSLTEKWVNEGYLSKAHERKMFSLGENYLKGYFNSYDKQIVPVALEQPFVVPLPPISNERPLKIGGKIDRVDILADGRVEIIDYKTGANTPTQKEVDRDLQLTFYALAATRMHEPPFKRKPEELILSLYYFESQMKLSTTRSSKQLDEAIDEIYKWRRDIESSDFKCSHGYFCQNGCEYAAFCSEEE